MASNDNIIADNEGEIDDWLELGNHLEDTVNLHGCYLRDNESNPFKYRFSDSFVTYSDSFILLWANKNDQQGLDRLNFKLGPGREWVLITNTDKILIDSIYFNQQVTGHSYDSYPDYFGN